MRTRPTGRRSADLARVLGERRPHRARADVTPTWTSRTLDRCLWALLVAGTTVSTRDR